MTNSQLDSLYLFMQKGRIIISDFLDGYKIDLNFSSFSLRENVFSGKHRVTIPLSYAVSTSNLTSDIKDFIMSLSGQSLANSPKEFNTARKEILFISGPTDWIHKHFHKGKQAATACLVKCFNPENFAIFTFYQENGRETEVKVSNNNILIFRSFIPHSVRSNLKDDLIWFLVHDLDDLYLKEDYKLIGNNNENTNTVTC